MDFNILIGLGGTGSKIVESYVYLAACGLGPASTRVILIDQDSGNGNLQRTRQSLECFVSLSKGIVGEHGSRGDTPLFRSKLEDVKHSSWHSITSFDNLDELFFMEGMSEELRLLYECLFSRDDRISGLGVGFRGKPAVGAATIQARAVRSPDDFMKGLGDPLRSMEQGDKVNVFLAGSLFGGTGAAALPVIPRQIRGAYDSRDSEARLRIGAVMMLPYFAFPRSKGGSQTVVEADSLLRRTQQALHYYGNMLDATAEGKDLFHAIYFVGWPKLIPLGYCQEGNQGQENPSLVPELLAALSAARFFNQREEGRFVMGVEVDEGREDGAISDGNGINLEWEDMPGVGSKDIDTGPAIREALGQLVRYAYAYHYLYHPNLKDRESFRKVCDEHWARKLLPWSYFDPGNKNTGTLLENMDDFCRGVLQWAAGIAFFNGALVSDNSILFKAESFAQRPTEIGKGQPELAKLKDLNLDRFERLIPPKTASGLDQVFARLHDPATVPRGADELARFFGALYEANKL